ncbi:MAG: hypothetical protein AAB903_02385 [Patescibacteria group bacterium]
MKSMMLVVALVVSFTTAVPAFAGMPFATQMMVVDATGKEVGVLIDTGGTDNYSVVVLEPNPGLLIKVLVWRDRITSMERVAFEAPDCSGTPFFMVPKDVYNPPSAFPMAAILPPGNSLYVERVNAVIERRVMNSSFSAFEGCVTSELFSSDVVPAEQVSNDLGFRQPYRITTGTQASKGCCGDCNADRVVGINELVNSVNNALAGCSDP